MADKKVKLYAKATKTGQVKVTVTPWRRHAKSGDQVVFTTDGSITRYVVNWNGSNSPFVGGAKLHRSAGNQDRSTRPVSDLVQKHDVYEYSVTMYFDDPEINGYERVVTVDPDMVID